MSYPSRVFRGLVAMGVAAFITLVATAADAAVTFDVPAGDATATLRAFAQQAKREIVFPPMTGVRTNAVKGEFTVKVALDRMLAGTDLVVFEDQKSGAIVVSIPPAELKNAPSRPADRAAAEPDPKTRIEEGKVQLGTFEVLGTKLINADLPRSRDDVQPYVVFGRAQLESAQVGNLDDFLRTRLPMNQTISPQATSGAASNGSAINLRGLGQNQTLILLDGRRLPARPFGGGGTLQADINGIPLSMVERIEILPSTASGIYGGGATGGVINIITRKDYSGAELAFNYLNTFHTDASTRRVDFNSSSQLNSGRTMLTLNYSRTEGTALQTRDRDFTARSRALLLQNNPAAFFGTSTPPTGALTNIRSQNGANLVLKNGTPLNSPVTYVPAGYPGTASDGGAALVANAGQYDLNVPNTLMGKRFGLMSVPTTQSYGLTLRQHFGDRVDIFLDASRVRNRGELANTPTNLGTATIAANSPNNPFTSAINVRFPVIGFDDSDALTVDITTVDRFAVGMNVRLAGGWSAGLDFTGSQSRSYSNLVAALLGDPDGTGPGLSYATAVSSGVLDVLRDLNARPLDLAPYRMPQPYSVSDFTLEAREFTLRGSGPLIRLPAGEVTLSASAQTRKENTSDFVSATPSTANPNFSYRWSPAVSMNSRAYYAELRIPVLGEKVHIPLARSLEFQASVRRDDLTAHTLADTNAIILPSSSGPFPTPPFIDRKFTATKSTAGFKWGLTQDLVLRGSYGTGYLPPSLNQLGAGLTFTGGPYAIIDPRRGNTSYSITPVTLQGGSPELQPEESKSISAGAVLTPRFLPGLRVSIDYTRIVKENEIGIPIPQTIVDLESLFPDRVGRAALTPQDQALGYTGGVITQLNLRALNIAGRRLAAWDVQADYTWKMPSRGEVQVFALATYQPQFAAQTVPTAAWIENAGYGSTLKLRGNAGLTWSRGPWTLGWTTQYYSSYYIFSMATSTAATRASQVLNQGSASFPSQMYHDISLTYRWGAEAGGWRRFLAHTSLIVGVQNVFNTSPLIVASTSEFGSASYNRISDPRMARYTINVRKSF